MRAEKRAHHRGRKCRNAYHSKRLHDLSSLSIRNASVFFPSIGSAFAHPNVTVFHQEPITKNLKPKPDQGRTCALVVLTLLVAPSSRTQGRATETTSPAFEAASIKPSTVREN